MPLVSLRSLASLVRSACWTLRDVAAAPIKKTTTVQCRIMTHWRWLLLFYHPDHMIKLYKLYSHATILLYYLFCWLYYPRFVGFDRLFLCPFQSVHFQVIASCARQRHPAPGAIRSQRWGPCEESDHDWIMSANICKYAFIYIICILHTYK